MKNYINIFKIISLIVLSFNADISHEYTSACYTRTNGGPAVRRRMTMSELGNWLWTAASASVCPVGDLSVFAAPYCCHILQLFHQPLLLHLIILLSEQRRQKWPVFSFMEIVDCMLSGVRDRQRVISRVKQWSECKKKQDCGGFPHSKELIYTECLSNSNIQAQRAFHLKSNGVTAWNDENWGNFKILTANPFTSCFPITVSTSLCLDPVKEHFQVGASCEIVLFFLVTSSFLGFFITIPSTQETSSYNDYFELR